MDETPQKPKQTPLEEKLIYMRNANPQVFRDFVSEFANFTTVAVNQAVYAPAAEVQIVQGRAQMCQHLMQVFAQVLNAK